MKNVYNTPKMDLIGVSHIDVLCTSNYKFEAVTGVGDGNTDCVGIDKLLNRRS